MAEDDSDRLDQLAARQDSLESKLDKIIDLVTGSRADPADGQGNSTGASGGQSVAAQVRAELAKHQAEQQAADDKQKDADDRAEIRAQLARLTEQPPQPRRQRVMWGGRD